MFPAQHPSHLNFKGQKWETMSSALKKAVMDNVPLKLIKAQADSSYLISPEPDAEAGKPRGLLEPVTLVCFSDRACEPAEEKRVWGVGKVHGIRRGRLHKPLEEKVLCREGDH